MPNKTIDFITTSTCLILCVLMACIVGLIGSGAYLLIHAHINVITTEGTTFTNTSACNQTQINSGGFVIKGDYVCTSVTMYSSFVHEFFAFSHETRYKNLPTNSSFVEPVFYYKDSPEKGFLYK